MTLDTRIYVHDPVDYREVFLKCNQILGATERTQCEENDNNIMNKPCQGLSAWLIIYHGHGAPYQEEGTCGKYCDAAEEDGQHMKLCGKRVWLEISLDTAYSYKDEHGGCSDLHARIIRQLGNWLDGKNVTWSWQNEYTGDVYRGATGLETLTSSGKSADAWFSNIVQPVIERHAESLGTEVKWG